MRKFAWSFSALNAFETCPYQFYRLRVKKDIREKESPQMLEGHRQHKAFEKRLGDDVPLPPDMKKWEPLCKKLTSTPHDEFHVEYKVALTPELEPTTFFAKDVWVRGVFDVVIRRGGLLRIGDWKTGKRKMDNEQLKLFAALGFAAFEGIKKVKTSFWWLPAAKADNEEFDRESLPLIWQEFEPRVERMRAAHEEDVWPKKPSGLCRGWCSVKDCPNWEPKA
jgi:hypothetical protein